MRQGPPVPEEVAHPFFGTTPTAITSPSGPVRDARGPEAARRRPPSMPSDVDDHVGVFDRFAGAVSKRASRAPFFALCVLLVVVWAPTYFLLQNVDTWQLIINTMTTIVTFLLVALLQNSQYRADEATQHKLNALADGLADLMEHFAATDNSLGTDIAELRAAVGLEVRETSN